MELVLHHDTDVALKQWRHSLPQSGLLYGPRGVGLLSIAKELASRSGQHILIQPEKATKTSQALQISVERIRELYRQTRTATGGVKRIIIIDDAEFMSLAAQNAFLKLLEEPNASTSFLLTSHQPERLIATVRSRLQSIHVKPVNAIATRDFLKTLPTSYDIDEQQLLFIARGLPAELVRLTSSEVSLRSAVAKVTFAKNILQAPPFERLALIGREKLTRPESLLLIETLLRLMRLKPTASTPKEIEDLLKAYDRINGGGNIQVQLISALI